MNFIIQYILPLFYLLLTAFLLQRDKLLRSGGVLPWVVVLFFLAKCIAGFLYSYIALHYIPNRGDIWVYYDDGLELFKTLLHQPSKVDDRLQEMFSQGEGSALASGSGAARSAFEGIKFLHFVFNLFSWGNLYTNTILFNGLACWAFLRCWVVLKNEWRSRIPGAWVFLFPSAFFYTAGIHKEGIMYILIAWLIPLCYHLWKNITFKKMFFALLAMALFVFFKLFVAALFAASMILFWFLYLMRDKRKLVFVICMLAAVLFFFGSELVWPGHGLPSVIVHKQQEFLALEAASSFKSITLEPTFTTFIKALPSALYNVFFRPLPGQGGKALYYVYTLEIFLFWSIIIYFGISNRFRLSRRVPSMVLALLVFAFFNLLIIGYTIPNIGATMRYRSIFLPFIGLFAWYLLKPRPIGSMTYGIENRWR